MANNKKAMLAYTQNLRQNKSEKLVIHKLASKQDSLSRTWANASLMNNLENKLAKLEKHCVNVLENTKCDNVKMAQHILDSLEMDYLTESLMAHKAMMASNLE